MNKAQVHKGRRSEAIRDVFWCQREKDFADIGDISKIFISVTRSYINPSDVAMNLSGAASYNGDFSIIILECTHN